MFAARKFDFEIAKEESVMKLDAFNDDETIVRLRDWLAVVTAIKYLSALHGRAYPNRMREIIIPAFISFDKQ